MALLYWFLGDWLGKPWRAGQCQFWMLWAQGRSSRTTNWTFGFQSSSYSMLYCYIKPTIHSYYYHIQYHYPHKKLPKTAWISDVWKLFTHSIIANEYTSTCFNFYFFSIINQEAIMQLLLKIAIFDRILENHPYGRILHNKYLVLKSSLKILFFFFMVPIH